MISMTLFKRECKANMKILLLFLAVLTMYCGVILMMYDPELGKSLNMMAESMPDLFAAFGMSNPGSTLLEFIGTYLYGFILIVIPFLCIVLITHRMIVRYVDRGSMAYLLASGNSRTRIIVTQAFYLILCVLMMCIYVSLFLLICGNLMFDEPIEPSTFLTLNLSWFGLMMVFAGLMFLSSVSFNEAKLATGLGAGMGTAFILISMLSNVSDKISFLKYFSITTLFQSKEILANDTNTALPICILFLISLLCFYLGVVIFKKRDLPL